MSHHTDLVEVLAKFKKRTVFDPSRCIGVALFFALVMAAFALGGGIGLMFNMPSFIVCVGGMLALSMIAYGVDRQSRAIRLVFWVFVLRSLPSESFSDADVRVIRGMIASVYASGAIGFLIGLMQILALVNDTSVIMPALAVALICPLYALLIAEGVLRPVANHLSERAGE